MWKGVESPAVVVQYVATVVIGKNNYCVSKISSLKDKNPSFFPTLDVRVS